MTYIKNGLKIVLGFIFPNTLDRILAERYLKTLPSKFVDHIKKLPKNSIVIDLGANVGLVSLILSQKAQKVYAFEPNREALKELRRKAKNKSNITILPVAAGVQNKKSNLYLHKDSSTSKENLTQASSLVSSKPNVSEDLLDTIEEIDFAEFLLSLNENVELIKIDIEGYEIQLINHLLDKCNFEKIGRIYVETHENQWPSLTADTERMIRRVRESGLEDKFDFDWI